MDFDLHMHSKTEAVIHSHNELALEGLDTHTGQEDDGPDLELVVDDEPIIVETKAWTSNFLTCFHPCAVTVPNSVFKIE